VEQAVLTVSENAVMDVFRSYLVGSGQMLCFDTPQLAKHMATLRQLVEKGLVVEEQFAGGFSLTRAGFRLMRGRAG
jgi:hypothetical protein